MRRRRREPDALDVALDLVERVAEICRPDEVRHRRCPDCADISGGGVSGVTEARNLLGRLVTLMMLAGEAAADDNHTAHPWLQKIGIHTVPREFAELTAGLAGRPPRIAGHDSIDGYEAQKKIIAAAGLPETWGLCPRCGGTTEVPGA